MVQRNTKVLFHSMESRGEWLLMCRLWIAGCCEVPAILRALRAVDVGAERVHNNGFRIL